MSGICVGPAEWIDKMFQNELGINIVLLLIDFASLATTHRTLVKVIVSVTS